MARPNRTALVKTYGEIANLKWARQSEFMVKMPIPAPLASRLLYAGKPLKTLYINKDMVKPLTQAFENVMARGLTHEIVSYHGIFALRNTRGSTRPSTHCYGLAIDINAKGNGLGETPHMSAQLVKAFTDAGFVWGGSWKRKDGMHFQYVTEA